MNIAITDPNDNLEKLALRLNQIAKNLSTP